MQQLKKYGILFILIVTIATYLTSLEHGFTHLDDYEQVVENPNIRAVNASSIKAIFSSTSVGMYQPLTTFFYALTYTFLGKEAYNFHVLSLLFHLFNIVLVYLLLKKLKLNESYALLFASIFALHPMQVESVSWVSAFSNLTYSCFYLLALIYYRNFTLGYSKAYYITLLLFLLSLFSKSTAVTLPMVLLAMDYFQNKKIILKDFINKLPFFALSFVFGLITIYSRESVGHLSDLSVQFNWFERVFLISYSFLFYPLKWIAPFELSAFYPYPEVEVYLPIVYYFSLPMLLILLFIVWKKRENSLLVFGTLFYLLTIAIVVQLIPVGNQLTTDRYVYLPMLGFFLILYSFLKGKKIKLPSILSAGIAVIFLILSFQRTKVWAHDGLIWEDVIHKYPKVAQAYNNLGSYQLENGNTKEAFELFNSAVELKPYYADALSNRGNLYSQMGNSQEALADYTHAIAHRPHADAYFNRANEYNKLNQFDKAIADYEASAQLKESTDTYTNWAYTLLQLKQINKADEKLNLALGINPNFAPALFLKGMIFQQKEEYDLACNYFRKAEKQNYSQAKLALIRFCN